MIVMKKRKPVSIVKTIKANENFLDKDFLYFQSFKGIKRCLLDREDRKVLS